MPDNNTQPRQIYHLIPSFRCKRCGQEMLFFTTSSGNMIDYKEFINHMSSLQHLINALTWRKVRFLKCLCCNQSYIIDWSKGWPEQLTDITKLQKFGIGLPRKADTK